jgi:hypothetical protein
LVPQHSFIFPVVISQFSKNINAFTRTTIRSGKMTAISSNTCEWTSTWDDLFSNPSHNRKETTPWDLTFQAVNLYSADESFWFILKGKEQHGTIGNRLLLLIQIQVLVQMDCRMSYNYGIAPADRLHRHKPCRAVSRLCCRTDPVFTRGAPQTREPAGIFPFGPVLRHCVL